MVSSRTQYEATRVLFWKHCCPKNTHPGGNIAFHNLCTTAKPPAGTAQPYWVLDSNTALLCHCLSKTLIFPCNASVETCACAAISTSTLQRRMVKTTKNIYLGFIFLQNGSRRRHRQISNLLSTILTILSLTNAAHYHGRDVLI